LPGQSIVKEPWLDSVNSPQSFCIPGDLPARRGKVQGLVGAVKKGRITPVNREEKGVIRPSRRGLILQVRSCLLVAEQRSLKT
jgi:hypothetical protein